MRRTSPYPIIFAILVIGFLSLIIDFSGILKTQVLQTPETLSSVKLIRQKTDPVQFDIYYEQVTLARPPDISIIIVNSLIESAGRYGNVHDVIDQVLLQNGTQELISSASSQSLNIKNISQQASTKLGTIITNLADSEYLSLEYDTVVNRSRVTLLDNPVPADFPFGYRTFHSPTSELLYVSMPGFHSILSFDEKVFIKSKELRHGALLLPDTITTIQELETLNQSSLVSQTVNLQTPPLIIEQNQIVIPEIPSGNLNTLIVRYRKDNNNWDYNYFLLSATRDITLKVPLKHMLDFYTDVEYSFAYISNGFSTINASFPYNSLLNENQYPAFFRTGYVSLLPELFNLKNSLTLKLRVNIAAQADAISIGVLTREPLTNLQQGLSKIEQKLPIIIFENDSAEITTYVSRPDQLPYFNLIGKNNQIWSRKIDKANLSLISQQFQPIPLLSAEQIPEMEIINRSKGDKLLCLIKTDTGSFSLAPITADLTFSTACLQSARRSGFNQGRLYPLRYIAESNKLEALKHFDFDATLGDQIPIIKNYDPANKIISLTNAFTREKVQLIVSSNPDFEPFSTQPVTLDGNSFNLPLLGGCDSVCYFKVVSIIRENESIVLGYASETLLFTETTFPVIQLCFNNKSDFDQLVKFEDLNFQILPGSGEPIAMANRPGTACFEYFPEETEENTISDLTELSSPSEILPAETIVFHSNGYSNNHINIPPQRHYLAVKTDSLQQVLVTDLVFEHTHLRSLQQTTDSYNQKSYLVNLLGDSGTLIPENKGNILIHTRNQDPYFLENLNVTPPLNETLLYPGAFHVLAIPNTVRFLPGDEIVVQGFRNLDGSIFLPLPVPERSKVRLFLENIFRPNIQVKQSITDGFIYNQENNFISLENPTGMISIPIQVSINKPTDVSQYERTYPPTPVPGDIDLATFNTQLIVEISEPPGIPNTSILDPIDLDRAILDYDYGSPIPLGGIVQASSYETGEGKFLTDECRNIFTYDAAEKLIKGKPSADTLLESCYFELSVRYLLKLPYAQIEVNTDRTYRIPILENPGSSEVSPEVIQVPVRKDLETISEIINIIDPIEEVIETSSEYLPKNNEGQLISNVGELSITFNIAQQQFLVSGNPDNLQSPVSRFIQAIRSESGELALLELQLIPVKQQELIIPITRDFPNIIDIPFILAEQGFTDKEISTISLATGSLTSEVEISEDMVISIFGLTELNDQVFSAIIEKEIMTPSSLVEFDKLVAGESMADEPNKVRFDFRLSVSEPETVTLNTLELKQNKNISIDLRSYIPGSHLINSTQIPSFLTRNGYQLIGKTPMEAQEIELLIQDFTDVKNYLIPITIVPDEVSGTETDPVLEIPDLKPAADEEPEICFPDISNLPVEYRDAICLAKQFRIISGSNGLFMPNDPINRAEISKILVTGPMIIFNIITDQDLQNLVSSFPSARFPDVPRSSWFFGFVETVKEAEIFAGYPDGTFKPGNAINQAEAAKVIVNTLLQLQPDSFTGNVIQTNTLPGDQWFSPYVRILNQNGGDLPEANEYDELAQPISRAQFVYNLLALIDSKAEKINSLLSDPDL